jgi:hypothetical protein
LIDLSWPEKSLELLIFEQIPRNFKPPQMADIDVATQGNKSSIQIIISITIIGIFLVMVFFILYIGPGSRRDIFLTVLIVLIIALYGVLVTTHRRQLYLLDS